MDEFSTPLDPETFERVWQRVSAGRDSPVVPGRPQPPRPGPDRPSPPPGPPPHPGPDRPPVPPDRPHRPPPPPEPPLGRSCRENEGFLRSMIDRELERSRSAQRADLPPRISRQALGRARRLAAALYLICGRWYLPQQGRRQRWPNRRAALRGLFRQSQELERDYRRGAAETRDRELRQLFRELADECAAEQQYLRHQLEL
jgi:hypothetical protein